MTDDIKYPAWYNTGKIEVIEFIEDKQLNHHLACVVKYVCRAGKKDKNKEIEDLEKAAWYLARLIHIKKMQFVDQLPVKPNMMDKVVTSEVKPEMKQDLEKLEDYN